MRTISLSPFTIVIFLSLFAISSNAIAPHDTPYLNDGTTKSRLSMVKELDQKYGHQESFCPQKSKPFKMLEQYPETEGLGLFGGIYINTLRQYETNRHKLSIWSYSNSSLTVEPYIYMQDFEANRSCKDSIFISTEGLAPTVWKDAKTNSSYKIDRLIVCQAWMTFFKNSQHFQFNDKQKKQLQRSLWLAHSLSLLHTWLIYKSYFEEDLSINNIPKKEYSQWIAWNRIVAIFLPRLNWNSCTKKMWPFLQIAMPDCVMGTHSISGGIKKICRPGNLNSQKPKGFLTLLSLKILSGLNLNKAIKDIIPELKRFSALQKDVTID